MSDPIIIFWTDSGSGPSSDSGGEAGSEAGETATEGGDGTLADGYDPEPWLDPWNPEGIDAFDLDEPTFASSGPFAANPTPNPRNPEYRGFLLDPDSIRVTQSEVIEQPSGGSRGEQMVFVRFDLTVGFEVMKRDDEGERLVFVALPAIVELMFLGPVIGADHTVTSPTTFERDVHAITKQISEFVYTLAIQGQVNLEKNVKIMVMKAYNDRRSKPQYEWPDRWKEYHTAGPVIYRYNEAP